MQPNTKGQGALEFLLIIGGALVVSVIAISIIANVGTDTTGNTGANIAEAYCNQTAQSICDNQVIEQGGQTYNCEWSATIGKCTVASSGSATAIPGCQVINTPGTYTLNSDISGVDPSGTSCVTITASNVTLDCQGHTITVTDVNAITIGAPTTSPQLQNVQINNCSLSVTGIPGKHGISMYGSNHSIACNGGTITNTASSGYGIQLSGATVAENANANTIDGCNITTNSYGIRFSVTPQSSLTNNVIRYTHITSGTFQGIFFVSTAFAQRIQNTLIENVTVTNLNYGVYAMGNYTVNTLLRNNDFSGVGGVNAQIYLPLNAGLQDAASCGNTIANGRCRLPNNGLCDTSLNPLPSVVAPCP